MRNLLFDIKSIGYSKFNQILSQNAKIKKASKINEVNVFNFGIPADTTKDGKVTCPFADECRDYCFAKKGFYKMPNVAEAYERRYKLTKLESFVEIMDVVINYNDVDYLRIHDSGDFYSKKYVKDWITIINKNKHVKFYCYTKSFVLFDDLEIPENLYITKSEGGKNDHLIKNDEKVAKIFLSEEELIEAGYDNATKNDLMMVNSDKIGLVKI